MRVVVTFMDGTEETCTGVRYKVEDGCLVISDRPHWGDITAYPLVNVRRYKVERS